MLNQLIELDKEILLTLNGSESLYWDQFMWLFTGKLIWVPLLISLVVVLFLKGWKEALLVLLVTVLVAALCDQISSSFFKPFFERLRPSREPSLAGLVKVVNEYRGGKYGFVSSHAANSFGVGVFYLLLFRRHLFTVSILLFALINCYTRIYLGVHYLGDIIGGTLLGILVGLSCYFLYLYLHKVLYRTGWLIMEKTPYTAVRLTPYYYTFLASFLFISVASFF